MTAPAGNKVRRRRAVKMHQTTVRFSSELWAALEQEAASAGVSVAQYVREAALARVSFTSGRRGDPDFEAALERATGGSAPQLQSAAAARQGSREVVERAGS